jgi:hypothetical protein
LRRVVGLAIKPDAAGLGQDESDSGKLASQYHVGWSRRAAAGDFEHAGDEAVRIAVWPVVDGPDGECATFGRVALSRQNVENRIVAHWSVVSISARRRMTSL